MIQIRDRVNLKSFNTFGIEVGCNYFVEINVIQDFFELIHHTTYQTNARLILGGGSNILFTKEFEGIVIKNNLKGIQVVEENEHDVLVRSAAGEAWHEFVIWCLNKNYAGIENLSLIPGCVGASPMQNIGAYGVEIKDVFESLEAYSMKTGEFKQFSKNECGFGYRESVFKRELKNQYFISSVTFRLKKQAKVNTSYGAINTELLAMKISFPGIKDVSNAVISIRKSKLPDPAVLGNAGSFFKNPEVKMELYLRLKNDFPDIVAYPLENGNYKLAAGWLIEQCGLKGYEQNGAAVHSKQALVLVNKGHASGKEVYELSTFVIESVNRKFGVRLEREVNII
jgi:UDP-N-acetylmuramate dehydrogenase